MDSKEYRRTLKEIIDGFSTCYLDGRKRYIKHQSISDVVDFEIVYDKHYQDAQGRGLPTEKEVFDQLRGEGVWSNSDDSKIESQSFYIDSLHKNKKNLFLKRNYIREELGKYGDSSVFSEPVQVGHRWGIKK